MNVKDIKYVKYYIELLNENFKEKIEVNVFSGKTMKLYDLFTAHISNGKWIITCVDYWTFISENFIELRRFLLLIAKEDGVDIEFRNSYIITQILQKKSCIDKKQLFIGKLKSIELS